jgi:tetratricopeptide (TPR) repeat protein
MSAGADPLAEAYHYRGVMALRGRDLGSAIGLISQAVSIDPNNARYRVNRGEAYRLSNQLALAIEDFTRATQIDPSNNANAWGWNQLVRSPGASQFDWTTRAGRATP